MWNQFLSHNKSLQFQKNQTHSCHRLGACTSSPPLFGHMTTPWQVRAKATGNIPWERDQISVCGIRMTLGAFGRDSGAVWIYGSRLLLWQPFIITVCLMSRPRRLQKNLRSITEMDAVLHSRGSSCSADVARGLICRCLSVFLGCCFFFPACVFPSSGESSGILGYERDRTYRTGGDTVYF